MQHMMTRWIETADARTFCEHAMAEQMLANSAPAPEPRSFATVLRLAVMLQPANWRLSLGNARPGA
jgi:hypothetical protein